MDESSIKNQAAMERELAALGLLTYTQPPSNRNKMQKPARNGLETRRIWSKAAVRTLFGQKSMRVKTSMPTP